MKILLTCFEPFGGRKTNLSQKAVERFLSRREGPFVEAQCSGYPVLITKNIVSVCLPVTFSEIEEVLGSLYRKYAIDRMILLGEYRKSEKIQIERVALNVAHGTLADNTGKKYELACVSENQTLASMTALNVQEFAARLALRKIPRRISHHAGTYVCNALYYHALQLCPMSLFLHLPPSFNTSRKNVPAKIPGKPHIDHLADVVEVAVQWMEEQQDVTS